MGDPMNPLKHIQAVSFLATNTSDVIKQVQATREPFMITVDGKIQVVVQDILSYQRTRDQIALLKMLALGQKAIEDGNVTDHEDFFAELEAEDEEVGSED
ncbi:prevent-host-death protein [Massilia sp. CCM 8734]|nr:prevent-host-death protein [Massilia sp. CCM 8734]